MLFGSCCYAFSFENIEETFFSLFWAEKKLYTIKNSLSGQKMYYKKEFRWTKYNMGELLLENCTKHDHATTATPYLTWRNAHGELSFMQIFVFQR